jgi:hypothetical protein
MSNLGRVGTILLILAALQMSCTKIQQPSAEGGALTTEKLAQTNLIPSDWGKLISVAISPDFPRLAQLWFQDEKGDIRLVFYEMSQNKIRPTAVLFRRS